MDTTSEPDPNQDTAAQILALQAEVARLQEQLATKTEEEPPPAKKQRTPRRKPHWARNFWSVVLITVACLLAPLSVVSVWARGEVTDTDRYIATVAPLASKPR